MSSRSKKPLHSGVFSCFSGGQRDSDDKALRCDCGAFLFLLLPTPLFPPPMDSWRNRGGIERGESCSVRLWERRSNSNGRFHLHSGTAVQPNWDNSHLWYNFIPTSVWLLWSHAPIPLSTLPLLSPTPSFCHIAQSSASDLWTKIKVLLLTLLLRTFTTIVTGCFMLYRSC